jgi:uncharacterized NAD-dependent epimerase/dehydratase family protein
LPAGASEPHPSPLLGHRYLVLTEGHLGPQWSKTANSAFRYLPERCAAVLDSSVAPATVEEVLGFGGRIPVVATLQEGLEYRPNALLIGIAPQGGGLPTAWRETLLGAIAAGLDVVSGLHLFLGDDPQLAAAAAAARVRIFDLRRPPPELPVTTGLAREVGALTVLTVGTDCNIGKMTAGLQLRSGLEERGFATGFAATGQTGILIEGRGIAVDAVVADFVAGAAERLVLEHAPGHEILIVEGQGSLLHPGYSGVTLGLLHGSMPDVQVLCHQAGRQTIYGAGDAYRWVSIPPLSEVVRFCEAAIAPLRSSPVVGICLNTRGLSEAAARDAVRQAEEETGLPATDPVRFEPAPVVEAIIQARERKSAGN